MSVIERPKLMFCPPGEFQKPKHPKRPLQSADLSLSTSPLRLRLEGFHALSSQEGSYPQCLHHIGVARQCTSWNDERQGVFRSNSKAVHRERPAIGRRLAEHFLQEIIYAHFFREQPRILNMAVFVDLIVLKSAIGLRLCRDWPSIAHPPYVDPCTFLPCFVMLHSRLHTVAPASTNQRTYHMIHHDPIIAPKSRSVGPRSE